MELRSLESIKIPRNFLESCPSEKKLKIKINMILNNDGVPVIISKDGTLVDGYITYLAYKKLNYKEVPYILNTNFEYQYKISPICAVYKKQLGKCICCDSAMTEPKQADKKRQRGISMGKFPVVFEDFCYCQSCIEKYFCRDISDFRITDMYKRNQPSKKKLNNRRKNIQDGNLFCVYINSVGEIVDGYINYLVYKELGYSKIPSITVDNYYSTDSIMLKAQLFKSQNGVCYICDSIMTLDDKKSEHYATIDHVVPRSAGGSYRLSNLRCACKRCNCLKMDLPLTDSLKKKIKYTVSDGDINGN